MQPPVAQNSQSSQAHLTGVACDSCEVLDVMGRVTDCPCYSCRQRLLSTPAGSKEI